MLDQWIKDALVYRSQHMHDNFSPYVGMMIEEDMDADNDIPGPGKFEGNESIEVSEVLLGLCGQSFYNEQFGSVSEYGMWEALFTNLTIRNGKTRAYIVTENDQGFFSYTEYEKDEEAKSKYFADLSAFESHYANGENL